MEHTKLLRMKCPICGNVVLIALGFFTCCSCRYSATLVEFLGKCRTYGHQFQWDEQSESFVFEDDRLFIKIFLFVLRNFVVSFFRLFVTIFINSKHITIYLTF